MKKLISILLVSVILLTFAACGKDSKTSDSSQKPDSSKVSSAGNKKDSENNKYSSDKEKKDTRYRATRQPKPDGFKYKEASILILGDSITAGDGTPSGYRYSLFEQLYAAGARFRFVGPNKSVSDERLPEKYKYHGGVGGRKIEEVTNNVNDLCNYKYDIVLIMIGTNDNGNLDGITDRYKTMLDAIIAKNPDASIYCGEAPPQKGQKTNDAVYNALDTKLPDIAKEYTEKGKKVTHVSMHANLWEDNCYNDAVHPNEYGNSIIAKYYCDAILDEVLMINDSGDSNYVEPVHVTGVELSESKFDLAVKAAKTIVPTVSPAKAEVKNVLWSSSDTKIASVNAYGKVVGVAKGKATITAKTLDGNFTKTCEVNVVASTEPASTEVFKADFNKAANWTGDTSDLNGSFAGEWMSKALTITSAQEANAGNDFKVTFEYKVSGNGDMNADNKRNGFTSVKYNGYEVRIYNCVRAIDVYAGDDVIGSFEPDAASQDSNTYVIKVLKGKLTLSLNGEDVISCNSSGVSGSKNVQIKLGDLYRCNSVSSLTVNKF